MWCALSLRLKRGSIPRLVGGRDMWVSATDLHHVLLFLVREPCTNVPDVSCAGTETCRVLAKISPPQMKSPFDYYSMIVYAMRADNPAAVRERTVVVVV